MPGTDNLIRFRPFRNADLPDLADIWRARAFERGLAQPMSADLFDQLVLAKPYFDREGLIVAVEDDRVVGFVHAAFGPSEDESTLSRQMGVICMLLVRPDYRRLGIGSTLLQLSEQYLRDAGAKVLYAGGIRPLNPFYLGLYGGSELPGVLDSDAEAQRRYEAAGYRAIDRCLIFQRDLSSFRPPVSREQLQIRRRTTVQVSHTRRPRSWWEACTQGWFERTGFDLLARDSGQQLASVTFWDMEPLASSWGVHAAGLTDLMVPADQRRQGLATFLLSEAFRQLQQHHVSLVEAQTMEHNRPAIALYESLGFQRVDQGNVYRKDA